MIIAKSDKNHTEVMITGDSREVLKECLWTVSQVLKVFGEQNAADVVLKGLVDVADSYAASITNTNFKSKGEN